MRLLLFQLAKVFGRIGRTLRLVQHVDQHPHCERCRMLAKLKVKEPHQVKR